MVTAINDGDQEYIDELAEYGEDYTSQEIADDSRKGIPSAALILALDNSTKQWQTQGDSKVRIAHQEADGQEVGINDFYMVMGQMLMYPGDSSMGASASNVCNCRCSSVYL